MEPMAHEVYEVVLEDTARKRRFLGWLGLLFVNFMGPGAGPANPGGRIISVRHIDTGVELFRHIEDFGDDEANLLGGIRDDMASMTVSEFEREWSSPAQT